MVTPHVSAVSSNGADAEVQVTLADPLFLTPLTCLLSLIPRKPGMTASVDIMIQHMDNVLTVPLFMSWTIAITRQRCYFS